MLLAPMAGITDLPFRKIAHRYGAGLVVSEMVASKELLQHKLEPIQRALGCDEISPLAVQIAGRDAHLMGEAAKFAVDQGANIIDINMGCPAKKVTNGLSGSALMRDLDHAVSLIDSVVKNVEVPVTLKMRTGWDDRNRNAPELAKRAEAAGVKLITVHGRTRCQFYQGSADWGFVRSVKDSVDIPVVINGDITNPEEVKIALEKSGADAVMIGRGAQGRPWLPGHLGEYLNTGQLPPAVTGDELRDLIVSHYEDILSLYGVEVGVRVARKHLCWYAEHYSDGAVFRTNVCRSSDPNQVLGEIRNFFDPAYEHTKTEAA